MVQLATNFINSDEFIDSFLKVKEVDEKFVDIVTVVRDNVNKPNSSYFEQNFNKIFSPGQASTVANSDEYRFLFTCAGNSIISSAVVGNIPSAVKSLNVFIVYALHLIQQLASNSIGSEKINESTIIIPKDIFPLPPVKKNQEGLKKERERIRRIMDTSRKKTEEATRYIEENNNAIDEIMQVFKKILRVK